MSSGVASSQGGSRSTSAPCALGIEAFAPPGGIGCGRLPARVMGARARVLPTEPCSTLICRQLWMCSVPAFDCSGPVLASKASSFSPWRSCQPDRDLPVHNADTRHRGTHLATAGADPGPQPASRRSDRRPDRRESPNLRAADRTHSARPPSRPPCHAAARPTEYRARSRSIEHGQRD